ncbi:ESCRT-II subunit protein SNF8 SCDLUD_000590 [Saccharomycodes ludwigii]|uniref:ESCRT-II subunit protein SNF8 n=1 Tax=Saccharomycodes ludwigii TaxID=36035 RepID=UPI001E8BB122|nr:hypothetical protein SCDLUD_000590 [Saccharomycodes ludwigii]KAH3902987.1 hypothetical protein SCDLUD_000590 [Saccharomycodes ludwigii]
MNSNNKFGIASLNNNIKNNYRDDITITATTGTFYDPSIFDKQKSQLSQQLSVFKDQIINFAKTHNKQLQDDPQLRRKFVTLCNNIGIDFLQLVDKDQKQYIFDPNDFYYELCVKIIEIARDMGSINGGLISFQELLIHLNNIQSSSNNSVNVNELDLEKSFQMLTVLKGGFEIITVGKRGKKFLQSVPIELTSDQAQVLDICSIMGYTSKSILRDNYGWKATRCATVLNAMVTTGLLWIDNGDISKNGNDNETLYWDPAWIINC